MSKPIRGQGGHLVFPIGPKNTNLVEGVEILLPVKFRWIPFSGFRGEVENVSANQRPGRPSCFSDRPEKHKLGRGRWDLASCQVSLNSVQRFQRRSRKCESLRTDDDGRTDGRCAMTIAHLSLWLRWAKKTMSLLHWPWPFCSSKTLLLRGHIVSQTVFSYIPDFSDCCSCTSWSSRTPCGDGGTPVASCRLSSHSVMAIRVSTDMYTDEYSYNQNTDTLYIDMHT